VSEFQWLQSLAESEFIGEMSFGDSFEARLEEQKGKKVFSRDNKWN
jgi:hypothetical protein